MALEVRMAEEVSAISMIQNDPEAPVSQNKTNKFIGL
jgi:hypothetical protein